MSSCLTGQKGDYLPLSVEVGVALAPLLWPINHVSTPLCWLGAYSSSLYSTPRPSPVVFHIVEGSLLLHNGDTCSFPLSMWMGGWVLSFRYLLLSAVSLLPRALSSHVTVAYPLPTAPHMPCPPFRASAYFARYHSGRLTTFKHV